MSAVVAALDLGSNTVKLTAARVAQDGTLEVVFEHAEITRIGEGLDRNGVLLEAAQARTLAAVVRLAEGARAAGAREVRAVGTAGLRGAANAGEFLAQVHAATGIQVEIISGLREAELAFRAPAQAFGPGPIIVMDLGGRSTELIVGVGPRIDAKTSLEIGSVRLTERHLPSDPPTPDELSRGDDALRELLAAAPDAPEGGRLVGVSGTIQALAGLDLGLVDADELTERTEGRTLTRAAIERLFDELRVLPKAERVRGTVLPPGRADVIIGGLLIVRAVMDHYRRDAMLVSGRGVRWGLLYQLRDEVLGA